MKETMKKISAGLLTLAVIGGVGGYLANSLVASHAKPATEVTNVQTSAPAIETVTVVGTRRAS
jgi:hypothetical protein